MRSVFFLSRTERQKTKQSGDHMALSHNISTSGGHYCACAFGGPTPLLQTVCRHYNYYMNRHASILPMAFLVCKYWVFISTKTSRTK